MFKLRCRLAGSHVLALLAMLTLFYTFTLPTACADDSSINCDAHQGACSQEINGLRVSLEITPQPVKAMQDLVFRVSLSGNPPAQSPYIDLAMPGMKMGPHRVELKNTGTGAFEGRGVIVRCPSGRRTWFANITITGTGDVKFIFDVIY